MDLSFTGRRDKLLHLLLSALWALPSLTRLSLHGNRPTRAAAKELTEALKDLAELPCLAWIDLGHNVDMASVPQPLLGGLRRPLGHQASLLPIPQAATPSPPATPSAAQAVVWEVRGQGLQSQRGSLLWPLPTPLASLMGFQGESVALLRAHTRTPHSPAADRLTQDGLLPWRERGEPSTAEAAWGRPGQELPAQVQGGAAPNGSGPRASGSGQPGHWCLCPFLCPSPHISLTPDKGQRNPALSSGRVKRAHMTGQPGRGISGLGVA